MLLFLSLSFSLSLCLSLSLVLSLSVPSLHHLFTLCCFILLIKNGLKLNIYFCILHSMYFVVVQVGERLCYSEPTWIETPKPARMDLQTDLAQSAVWTVVCPCGPHKEDDILPESANLIGYDNNQEVEAY